MNLDDNNAGAAGEGDGIVLNGGGEANPPAGTTPDPAAAGGGQAGAGNPDPAAGVVLTGKDDTGTGENGGDAGKGEAGNQGGGNDGGAGDFAVKYPEGFKALPDAEHSMFAHVDGKNLPPEEAAAEKQALADLYVKTRQSENAALMAQMQDTKRQWAQELAADPDFGGANLAQTNKDANQGLRHYAPELIPRLAEWNLDTNPDLVRVFARLGRGLKENRSPRAEKPGQRRPKTLVDSKEEMLAREEAKARKA